MTFDALDKDAFHGSDLAGRLFTAARKRAALTATTEVYRLHDADVDFVRGATVERFGNWAVLGLYTEQAMAKQRQIAAALMELGAAGVYVKVRARADLRKIDPLQLAPKAPVAGEQAPEELVVVEDGRRFWIRLGDGLSTGLFLDQRDNRSHLQRRAKDQRVLNLFCYTCSFSVAAGLGGARAVTSVDSSGAVLKRGAANLRLNDIAADSQRLLRDDAIKWLPRAVRRGDLYDWVILDPPSFSSRGKSTFTVAKKYFSCAVDALRLLAPGGTLLAVTNHRQTSAEAFETLLINAAGEAKRSIISLHQTAAQVDCPPGVKGLCATKSIMVKVK